MTRALVVFLCSTLLAAPSLAQMPPPLPASAPNLTAHYGPNPLQVGELRLPAGKGPFPVAVVVHGGCWTKGYAQYEDISAFAEALTKRGIARSVSLFTSSTAPDEPSEFIMPNGDTLVQYMGGREAAATAQRLLSLGYARTTPVVVVENCSRDNERILDLELGTLEQGLAQCSGPVLVMIGEALARRD